LVVLQACVLQGGGTERGASGQECTGADEDRRCERTAGRTSEHGEPLLLRADARAFCAAPGHCDTARMPRGLSLRELEQRAEFALAAGREIHDARAPAPARPAERMAAFEELRADVSRQVVAT